MTQTRRDRAHLAVVTTQSASLDLLSAFSFRLCFIVAVGLVPSHGPETRRTGGISESTRLPPVSPNFREAGKLAPWADHGPSGTNVLAMLSKESNNPR